jgi:exodeoxyribonuclease VII large subunit
VRTWGATIPRMESDDLPLFSTPSSPSGGGTNPMPDGPTPAGRSVPPAATNVISVSELNRRVKGMLEANFELRWVRGELSNVMRAASGHWYFSLKDSSAQVRCVMFRQRAQTVSFAPANGIEVEVRALPSLYEARGEFQLGVESMRRAGVGAHFEAFERLKRKLEAEGLFAAERKRGLPSFPRSIGIVTSSKAAALQDVLTTFKRRAPMIRIVIYPCAVQGAEAAGEIAAAISAAATRNEVDALLICRGGGAAEDLWSFNEEVVARAIVALQTQTTIPVVSGVGHETDFTICDFVADLRAPTPTAAAEMLSPDTGALLSRLQQQRQQMLRRQRQLLGARQQQVDLARRGLVSPAERIAQEHARLARFDSQLKRALLHAARQKMHQTQLLTQRLLALRPDVSMRRRHVAQLQSAITLGIQYTHQQRHQQLLRFGQALALLNPDQVLNRGYAMVTGLTPEQKLLTSAASLQINDHVRLRFHDGSAEASIVTVVPNTQSPLES